MKLFSEKVKCVKTDSPINIIQVENFEEIFFGVYEIEINKVKYLAEKVSEHKGNPVVSIPVSTGDESVFFPFVLTKGKQEVIFNENDTPLIGEDYIPPILNKDCILEEIEYAKKQAREEIETLKLQQEENFELEAQRKEEELLYLLDNAKREISEEFVDLSTKLKREIIIENRNNFSKIKNNLIEEVKQLKAQKPIEYIMEANPKKASSKSDKDWQKEIDEKIGKTETRLRKYISVYSGGGSVAMQFANGGTMGGDLIVTGALSASSYLGLPAGSGGSGGSDVSGLSGNWQSTYLTVNTLSSGWGMGSSSDVSGLSSNWQSTYTTVRANSANWTNAYSSLSGKANLIGGNSLSGNQTITGNIVATGNQYWGSTKRFLLLPDWSGFGELNGGTLFGSYGNTGESFSFFPAINGGIAGAKVSIGYASSGGTNVYSALEIENVTSGYGLLKLMKSGGKVLIGTQTDNGINTLQLSGSASITSDIEITDYTRGVILRSPNGSRFRVTVTDSGALSTTSI
jgi:hypothetical protein